MVKTPRISLWDIFVTFGTGLSVAASILFHLTYLDFINIQSILIDYQNSLSFLALISLPFLILLGLISEPILNFILEILKIKEKIREPNNEVQALITQINQINLNKLENNFEWMRDTLYQKDIDIKGLYEAFLNKYGLYKNLCSLFIINTFIFVMYIFLYKSFVAYIWAIIFPTISWFTFKKSGDFSNHLTGLVYRNYLIYKKEKQSA